MSTRFDEEVRLGEPWSFTIECHDEDGNLFTPVGAIFTMGDNTGPLIEKAGPSADVVIGSNRVVITIPTAQQANAPPGLYYGRVSATPSSGLQSWQADGTILVTAVRP